MYCRHCTAHRKNNSLVKNLKQKIKDWQTDNANSPRWIKKKERTEQLSNNTQCLRMKVNRDIQNEDEKTALTALAIAVILNTAERIGNEDSADNGHFGVTGFQKKHIHIIGNRIHFDYTGKTGMKQDKDFSNERIAKALKRAIKNSPSKFIFETSDGFRIKADKVNRYLEEFKISAKDIRGYLANKWMIEELKKQKSKVKSEEPAQQKKERKKIFNKALSKTAGEVGHGKGTLKKHYLLPELSVEFIEHGHIIDIKDLKSCECIYTFMQKNYNGLCIELAEGNINRSPELRAKVDKAYERFKNKNHKS